MVELALDEPQLLRWTECAYDALRVECKLAAVRSLKFTLLSRYVRLDAPPRGRQNCETLFQRQRQDLKSKEETLKQQVPRAQQEPIIAQEPLRACACQAGKLSLAARHNACARKQQGAVALVDRAAAVKAEQEVVIRAPSEWWHCRLRIPHVTRPHPPPGHGPGARVAALCVRASVELDVEGQVCPQPCDPLVPYPFCFLAPHHQLPALMKLPVLHQPSSLLTIQVPGVSCKIEREAATRFPESPGAAIFEQVVDPLIDHRHIDELQALNECLPRAEAARVGGHQEEVERRVASSERGKERPVLPLQVRKWQRSHLSCDARSRA
eukprot:4666736-Prymnesium_polylepis.1